MIKFSIIIPSFNSIKTLPFTIGSIVSQTLKNFEVIVIDDRSTDNQNYNQYKNIIQNISIIQNQKNMGPTFSKNLGIKYAEGEIICFLDSDDFWSPYYLEKINEYYIHNSKADALFTNFYNGEKWSGEISYKNVLNKGYMTAPSALSCKKYIFDKIKWNPTYYHSEDDEFCFELTKYYNVHHLNYDLVYYGSSYDSMSKDILGATMGNYKLITNYKNDIIKYCGIQKFLAHIYKCILKIVKNGMYIEGLRIYLSFLKDFGLKRTIKFDIIIFLFKLLIIINFYTILYNLRKLILKN